MSYLPLARKYRPMIFADLVGQTSVTRALTNAIRIGREPHGVIFSGVRGIGKTTVARLYAKALNCEDDSSQEPCGVCGSCSAITSGNHEDVIEIDGASNNGVEEIRSLRESVAYAPQRSRYKVYIIDEIHMLSTSAFNALLKTLEEPPGHVIFIFATTELHKVPQTVIGRCQTFYLQKIRLSTMVDRITEILKMEGIEFEDRALISVAREGHGSMRDALSFLDQAIALGGGKVTIEGLRELTSDLSATPYIDLLKSTVEKDSEQILQIVEKLDEEGVVFAKVCEETAKIARHCFVVRDLGVEHLDISLMGLDDQDLVEIEKICTISSELDLNRVFRLFVKCLSDLDGSCLDRFILENYLLEWCFDPGLPNVEELVGLLRGDLLSAKNNGASIPPRPKKSISDSFKAIKASSPTGPTNPSGDVHSKLAFPATWRKLIDAWKLKKPLQARKLEEVHPITYGPNKIVVAVDPDCIVGPALLKEDTQVKITAAFKELFGFMGTFSAVPRNDASGANHKGADLVLPESILQQKSQEIDQRREEIITKTKDAQVTRHIQSALGTTDVHVEITNTNLL